MLYYGWVFTADTYENMKMILDVVKKKYRNHEKVKGVFELPRKFKSDVEYLTTMKSFMDFLHYKEITMLKCSFDKYVIGFYVTLNFENLYSDDMDAYQDIDNMCINLRELKKAMKKDKIAKLFEQHMLPSFFVRQIVETIEATTETPTAEGKEEVSE